MTGARRGSLGNAEPGRDPVSVPPESRPGGHPAPLRLGVVVGVRNEERWLSGLLSSLESQDGLENVCCIAAVDGRSEDRSRSILESWRERLRALRVLDNEAKIAPTAFNLGIRECLASGAEAVLLISAHSSLHAGFLTEVQRVLADGENAVVGCVLDYPPASTPFEKASQAFAESRLGRRMSSYSRLSEVRETEIATFPAIRREVFDRVGFFDETMVRNQDIEFTNRARAGGFRIVTSPRMKCRYAPPSTWRRLIRQMYGNGVWVGRRSEAHGLRHLAPAAFFGILGVASLLSVWVTESRWLAASLGFFYLLVVIGAALAWLPKAGRGALWLPVIFVSTHAAYAAGTFRGLVSKFRSRATRQP